MTDSAPQDVVDPVELARGVIEQQDKWNHVAGGIINEHVLVLAQAVLNMWERIKGHKRVGSERNRIIEDLNAQVTALRTALDRLGSSETMTHSFDIKPTLEGDELKARIQFALAALSATPPAS